MPGSVRSSIGDACCPDSRWRWWPGRGCSSARGAATGAMASACWRSLRSALRRWSGSTASRPGSTTPWSTGPAPPSDRSRSTSACCSAALPSGWWCWPISKWRRKSSASRKARRSWACSRCSRFPRSRSASACGRSARRSSARWWSSAAAAWRRTSTASSTACGRCATTTTTATCRPTTGMSKPSTASRRASAMPGTNTSASFAGAAGCAVARSGCLARIGRGSGAMSAMRACRCPRNGRLTTVRGSTRPWRAGSRTRPPRRCATASARPIPGSATFRRAPASSPSPQGTTCRRSGAKSSAIPNPAPSRDSATACPPACRWTRNRRWRNSSVPCTSRW